MAQHYQIRKEDYPKIWKSVSRIAAYVSKDYVWRHIPQSYKGRMIYRKMVSKLPEEYNPGGRAITIEFYNLKKKDFGEDAEKATLEVHFTNGGIVTGVYYPL